MAGSPGDAAVALGPWGRVTTYTTSREVVTHAHAEFNLLFKLSGADTAVKVGGDTLPLSDDGAILINPWVPHARVQAAPAAGQKPTVLMAVLLDPLWLARLLGLPQVPLVRLFGPVAVRLDAGVCAAVAGLADELSHGAVAESTLAAFAQRLISAHADPAMQPVFQRRSHPLDARIARAMPLIRARVTAADATAGMDEVALQVGLSRSRFFELFRRCTGVSPLQYRDWLRFAAATEALAHADQPLAQVAIELGFTAPAHFTRFFSQHAGMPPSAFRRACDAGPIGRQRRRRTPVGMA